MATKACCLVQAVHVLLKMKIMIGFICDSIAHAGSDGVAAVNTMRAVIENAKVCHCAFVTHVEWFDMALSL